ncbi:MAG: transglycosylase domain-containing protein [Firmicutes bacterium]|nr:transglycosylase domain-containing protein [Bacillota bacterium]
MAKRKSTQKNSGPKHAKKPKQKVKPAVEEQIVAEEPVVAEEPIVTEEPVVTKEPVVAEEPAVIEEPAVVAEAPTPVEEPVVAAVEEPAPIEEPAKAEEPAKGRGKKEKKKKKVRKKWRELTGGQKVGRFIGYIFKTILLLVLIAGIYGGVKAYQKVYSFKAVAEEKYAQINPSMFEYTSNTIIYDAYGEVISEMNEIIYEPVKIEDVSQYVYDGYIAVEDQNFLKHHGIDYKAVMRAGIEYIRNKGAITQGGSTITQQVLKNSVLTNERSWDRKFTELFLAPMFEDNYSKNEIMQFYVNMNFYGNNCYGIEGASKYYFGKHAKDLTLAESSVLVGLTKGAALYNPLTNMEGVRIRQEYTLDRMLEEGMISQAQHDTALRENLKFIYERPELPHESYMTSFAIYSAAINLMEQEGFEFKYIFETDEEMNAYDAVYQDTINEKMKEIRMGGYEIYTSFRPDLQEKLQAILDSRCEKFTEVGEDGKFAFQSAAVLINNKTGYVEAMIGGRGTEDTFNRGYLAKRQPGSSIKPIVVYGPGFDSGFYYPSKVLIDKDNPKDKFWPKNVTRKNTGRMNIREAIVQSTNTIAYQIMLKMTPMYGLRYLEKMRFSSIAPADIYSTSVGLGGLTYGASPFEMAKAYSTHANLGEYIDNNCVIRIVKQDEGEIFSEDSARIRVYSEDASYMIIDCCKELLRRGDVGPRKARAMRCAS